MLSAIRAGSYNDCESRSNYRRANDPAHDYGNQESIQAGDWWFSQVIGDDPDSQTTHYADIKYKKHLYGAAFDIVLSQTPTFANDGLNKPRIEFKPYVHRLRNQGFVAWHRWAGEYAGSFSASKPSSVENEIHAIEPAMPFMKSYLALQIAGYKAGLPNKFGSTGYENDFPIRDGDYRALAKRETQTKSAFKRIYRGYQAGPFSPESE